MKTRLLAGVIGLVIVLPLILWSNPIGLVGLVAVALVLIQDEYAGMATHDMPHHRWLARWVLVVFGLLLFFVHTVGPGLLHLGTRSNAAQFGVGAVGILVALVAPMLLVRDVTVAGTLAVRLGFGIFYAPFLMAPLVWIRFGHQGIVLIFFLLCATWLGDTGAYFAGRFFGKRPLLPRVSPNKTVEGVIGGAVAAMIGCAVVKLVALPEMSWIEVLAMGLVLDLCGVLGDLAESMLKRAWGVKDSGWIMPGHGGILDRVDALLFSAPIFYAWLALTHPNLWAF